MKRTSCRKTKRHPMCGHYSYPLLKCLLGFVKATCPHMEQPKPGTKAAKLAEETRRFYA